MGQKYFLHKNEKVCYHITNTCSCGLSFPGKLAGLTRRGLVCVRKTMMKSLEKSLPRWSMHVWSMHVPSLVVFFPFIFA
ncbi:MAG: hypothetical protein LBG13_03395 [Holosporales bacterium]|nr:hypothetical protein [Holosporales bacterium]